MQGLYASKKKDTFSSKSVLAVKVVIAGFAEVPEMSPQIRECKRRLEEAAEQREQQAQNPPRVPDPSVKQRKKKPRKGEHTIQDESTPRTAAAAMLRRINAVKEMEVNSLCSGLIG